MFPVRLALLIVCNAGLIYSPVELRPVVSGTFASFDLVYQTNSLPHDSLINE
jgi:hypothetical protein